MERWSRKWQSVAPVALLTLLVSATHARADLLCVNGTQAKETRFAPADACRETSYPQLDSKTLTARLEREWQNVREDLTRATIEVALTMFFIKTNPPPSGTPPTPKTEPPPTDDGANEPPPPPPPPPPDGQGEVPPTNPPVDTPPPSATPEPASFVLAALGAGFISFCGWRRRKAKGKSEE